ncbi:TIGR03435 family protein [Granulicella tundricola]|uniref:Soil-associated protein, TIGR03435 family n=1 Tax=Granulicella tundricola (strain ATCC BAA-1859 / DSM 23138 / MP5ACTX9) TaxID=1198114 RepID=E8X0E5_GRATM|nr:TIGR03435 family protein [Granulicella tundricola]ADW67809.1 hypothetical protein AciX9_0739 [Granulicella tundricola MP5ACTX9]
MSNQSASLRRRLLLLLAAMFAAGTLSAHAQSTPTFEVATIKPAAPNTDGHTHINYPPGGLFSASNITLLALMQWAWDMPQKQILEGPSWLATTRFDLSAKFIPTEIPADPTHPPLSPQDLKRRMVQSLLAERCNLKLHPETRTLPAYDLILAKGGSKLQPSKANGKNFSIGSTHFDGEGLPVDLIAEQISHLVGRIVVDKTGLPDRYDLKLRWTPDDAPPAENAPPTLFTAIEEQLGLKLEPAKEAVPVLVIDHIDLPSAN